MLLFNLGKSWLFWAQANQAAWWRFYDVSITNEASFLLEWQSLPYDFSLLRSLNLKALTWIVFLPSFLSWTCKSRLAETAQKLRVRYLNSIPSTHIRWLTTTCNSAPGALIPLASADICTHMHTAPIPPTHTQKQTHMYADTYIYNWLQIWVSSQPPWFSNLLARLAGLRSGLCSWLPGS